VWTTFPRTLDEALGSLGRMFGALRIATPDWLAAARAAWADRPPGRVTGRAAVPVWRRPWIVLGGQTFAGDLLGRLGVGNVYGDSAQRYPRPALDEILAQRPELVVLPDEPYPFSADDGPEAFGGLPCALVSGRHLTWYGPSLVEAPAVLAAQLAPAARIVAP
jgi:hypothetical protein